MPEKINAKELSKISYLKIDRIDNRAIPLQPCFNQNGEWEYWIYGPNGLVRLQNPEPIEMHYFAKERVDANDGYLDFSNFILKRAYYPEIANYVQCIFDDVLNLGASIEKLDLFYNSWLRDNSKISKKFISTELEYIFHNCRSMFDLLQKIIKRLWNNIELADKSIQKKPLLILSDLWF